jgi:hypothetical protein
MSQNQHPVDDDPYGAADSSPDDFEESVDGDASSETFDDWGSDDLEAAYLKAMSALEASDLELPTVAAAVSATDSTLDETTAVAQASLAGVSGDSAGASVAPVDPEALVAELF